MHQLDRISIGQGGVAQLGTTYDLTIQLDHDGAGVEPKLYTLAEEKLVDAARDGSGLLDRAERNTRLMLTGLLRALGFTRVEVRFSEV